MRRKFGGPWLPSQPDASTELAVPQPALETRNTPGHRTVGKSHGRSLAVSVFHAVEKRDWISLNVCEFVARRLQTPLVVGRPAAFERGDVVGKMFRARANKLHVDLAPNT